MAPFIDVIGDNIALPAKPSCPWPHLRIFGSRESPRRYSGQTDHRWTMVCVGAVACRRCEGIFRGNIRVARSIRELGILYVCAEGVEALAGGSYVATGESKRLIQ